MGIVIEAWTSLNTERSIGMAIGQIPDSKIHEWAARNGFDRESTDLLVTVIRRLDRDFLEAERSKRPQKDA